MRGATVDIWHSDATGNYSGFGSTSSNKTFLRGVQTTDANGAVTFTTIYPGWYQGRAVHIHVKVYAGGTEVHTGQLFFDDAVNGAVFARRAVQHARHRLDAQRAGRHLQQRWVAVTGAGHQGRATGTPARSRSACAT